jgi:hypothetical protein
MEKFIKDLEAEISTWNYNSDSEGSKIGGNAKRAAYYMGMAAGLRLALELYKERLSQGLEL